MQYLLRLVAMAAMVLVWPVSSVLAQASFQGLGDLPGGSLYSSATGISADGTVVVGSSESGQGTEAFRWTEVGGMQGLGDLSGGRFNSNATGVSADGAVVVGHGYPEMGELGQGEMGEAFRWTEEEGMVGLGFLGGSLYWGSGAGDVSADGLVVVGYSISEGFGCAFRWTQVEGMVNLGYIPGNAGYLYVEGISADGSVIVGRTGGSRAFRWTPTVGMEDIRRW